MIFNGQSETRNTIPPPILQCNVLLYTVCIDPASYKGPEHMKHASLTLHSINVWAGPLSMSQFHDLPNLSRCADIIPLKPIICFICFTLFFLQL